MAVEIFCLIFKLFVIVFLIFSTIDVQFSVEQCFSVYRLSTFFCFAVRVWEWECKSPSPVISSSGVGTTGTGGYIVPPKSKMRLMSNFKQTTLTTRLYKVRTNLYLPPLTKTFRRASSLDWTIALGHQSRCAVAETLLDTTGRSNISARRRLRRLRDVSYTFLWYPKALFVYGRRRMAAWAGLASAAPRP